MFRRAIRHRFAFWAIAFAMLLKAAMPMLASASADLQGRTLVEVCTVYGVATVALDADGTPLPAEPHDPATAHLGDACTLASLVAFAADAPQAAGLVGAVFPPSHAPPRAIDLATHDEDAAWAARLKHGPPVLS